MTNRFRGRAVIFDLDGTLVDSGEAIVEGLRLALRAVGHPEPAEERLRAMIGVPLSATYDRGLGVPRQRVADCRLAYRDYWIREGRARTRLFDGARDLIATLAAAGRGLAVATAKVTEGAWNTVRRFELEPHFAPHVYGHEPGDSHGKEEVLARALASLGVAPAEALFIGDAAGDAAAAAHCGVDFVHCAYGYGIAGEVDRHPRCHQVADLAALRALLLADD